MYNINIYNIYNISLNINIYNIIILILYILIFNEKLKKKQENRRSFCNGGNFQIGTE